MLNITQTNQSYDSTSCYNLRLRNLDDMVFIYACSPVCFLGFFLCLSSAYIFSRADFKENFFAYLKIECVLMTIDLAINFLVSFAALYLCSCDECSYQMKVFTDVISQYLLIFLPSPIEATALVADIFAALNCLFMLRKQQKRQLISKLNPHLTMLIVFILFSLVFSYQLVSKIVSRIDFIIDNENYFNLITFTIRDGLILGILLISNVLLGWQVRKNLKKKLTIVENGSREKTLKSQQRITVMVLADCLNSLIGRVPMLLLYFLLYFDPVICYTTDLLPVQSVTSLAVYLSYLFKFFIYFKFNKRFRLVACDTLPFIGYFYNRVRVSQKYSEKK